MEWGWQTILILLGLISIALILFDGYRKMKRARAEALQLNVNGKPSSADDEEYNPELPGKVRVVQSSSNTPIDHSVSQPVKQDSNESESSFSAVEDDSMLFEGQDAGLKANELEALEDKPITENESELEFKADSAPQPSVIPVVKPIDLDEVVPTLVDVENMGSEEAFAEGMVNLKVSEPAGQESSSETEASAERSSSMSANKDEEQASIEADQDLPIVEDPATIDDPHLEEEVDEVPQDVAAQIVNYADPEAEVLSSRPEAQMVLIIHTRARSPEGFDGKEILYLFNSCDLRYGEKNIFHRFEETDGKGCIQFSVAQSQEPGTFAPESMEQERFPGLSFFLSLPGPKRPLEAYTAMSEMAMAVSRNLNADILDGSQSAMTPQTIEHERQQIMDYERKQRLAAKKRKR